MKFTKDEAHKELVAKMTTKGEKLNLSERSINEQLEKLIALIANDETELGAFVDSILPLVKTADANVRNDVSVGINEYKKNNPIQEPKKETKEEKVDPNAELVARLAALEHELSESKKQRALLDIKGNLINEMKKKGIEDEDWINSFVSEVNITEDFDVNAKAEHYLGVYNKMYSKVKSNVTPHGAGGTNNDKIFYGANTNLDIAVDEVYNAITFTPPSTAELFKAMMEKYREE
jgi:hypothetical protein